MSMIYEPAGKAREYAALAANLYSGCGHGCVYCYAPTACRRDRAEFYANPQPRRDALKQLIADAEKLPSDAPPVLLSFTTDPYQPIDEQYRLTRQAIGQLKLKGQRVEILTKGGTHACRDFDLLGPEDAFATTLTLLDDAESLRWEPGAALPADRIAAMKEAHRRGIRVWASLEPVIDPAQSLEIIKRTHEFVDLFKVGKLNYHPRAQEIDWRRFGTEAIKLLESLGCQYYIKNDLRALVQRPAPAALAQ